MAKWLTSLALIISAAFCAEITADLLRTDTEGNIIAEGNVGAFYSEYFIRADRVVYKPDTKEVFAKGGVYIRKLDGSFEVFGKEAYINLEEERGYFIDAQGRFERFYFSARRVEKLGEDLYEVKEGDVTTCPPKDKELRVCFGQARVSDRYVFSFNNSLKFFNLPVAYLPLLAFPVGERRTGLLPPMIGTDSYNDFIYIQPFFWAISRDKDMTFTLDYRNRQAKGIWAEYRQAFSRKNRLYARLSLYREPFPPGEWWNGRKEFAFRENRFRFELNISYKDLKLGLDIPSDPYFFEDVYFSRDLRTMPFTLSYISYTHQRKSYFLSLNLRRYYDLTSDNQDNSLNLLPELGFYLKAKKVGPAFVSLTSAYVNFYREEGLRTSRLLFIPEVEMHTRVINISNYTSVKFVNNFYLNSRPSEGFETKVNTVRIENRTPLFFQRKLWKFNMLGAMELVYSFSPKDFNNPQFDTFDNVVRENNVGLRYNATVEFADYKIASVFLETGYNLLGSYRFPTDSELIKDRFLPLRGIISFYPTKWFTLSQDFTYDVSSGILARAVSSTSLELGNLSLIASYFVARDSLGRRTSDQYSLEGELSYRRFLLGGSFSMDNLSGKELYSRIYFGLKGACWLLKLDFRSTYYGERKGYLNELFLTFNLFNLQEFKLPLRRR